jgi:Domain of unknown function (DUF5605)
MRQAQNSRDCAWSRADGSVADAADASRTVAAPTQAHTNSKDERGHTPDTGDHGGAHPANSFSWPSFRNIVLPEGDFEVDVIDTWNMTVERMPGAHAGSVRVELPARQYMAVRLRRVHSGD